ncbi:HNH endonuclease [Zunongwangia sp. SCSIO 43204]|uniref:HNH endonuclease n=1 Tax=Zunongwangia sp. SCSIO 43204 TaxID=2779359 RepID=UPI001CAA30A4|nr:HNH endonuclease [Zunongwangia sp. SCSIO 43204]UAB83511.1 HNH endonuclease [Zunongwangia sp. SCSIO 43204]
MAELNPNRIIFDTAKKVYEGNLSKNDGINSLVMELNMNRGSAQMIIVQIFPKLLNGDQFTRTLSVDLFNSFLRFIFEDYGAERLKISLSALKLHIDYIKEKGDAKIKLRKIYLRYLNDLSVNDEPSIVDEIEQDEIANHLKHRTKSVLIDELKNSEISSSEKVTVNHKTYKRNNKIVALIKILRDFKCQICGQFILKRDGSKYIEAAHIVPKHKKGNEDPKNIILLCPNHHKEFDLGNCEITKHTYNEIKFNLNGNQYLLSLAID